MGMTAHHRERPSRRAGAPASDGPQGASQPTAVEIGRRIREHREAAGMSQEELACACLVSRPTISSWERGRTQPSAEDLAYLSTAFDVPADTLLQGIARPNARTSPDRRELAVLFWVWWLLIALLALAVHAWAAVGFPLASLQLALSVGTLGACVGVMARAAFIARRNGLRTTDELVAYYYGERHPDRLAGRPAWVRFVKRHETVLGIVSGIVWYVFVSGLMDGALDLSTFAAFMVPVAALDVAAIAALMR